MTRALLALSVLALAACNTSVKVPPPCDSDGDCPTGTVCFAEGCGDPGKGVVVEVEGPALSSYRAHDFALADGSLVASYDFSLGNALALSGQLQRELQTGVPTDRTAYTDGVVVRAVGESSLLPGITRTFETRFDKPEFGFFEMNVGAGSFTVTATPVDPRVPPVSNAAVVDEKMSPSVTFAFPAADGAPALSGQLVRKVDTNGEPILVSAPFTAAGIETPTIDLQLIDPVDNRPLSQRFPIGTTTGEFAITISPDARAKPQLVLVATPREPGVPIPSKRFELNTPLPPAVSLAFGDYGPSGEVVGQIVDGTGTPVPDAHVVLEGTVGGGGTFRSKIVQTNAEGEFKVTALPSGTRGSFTLSVVPPQTSASAYTRTTVTVSVMTDGTLQLEPARVKLSERLLVKGSVLDPDGKPLANVAVLATLQPEKSGGTEVRSLPVEPTETTTDAAGLFTLRLDPGTWRFDYQPTMNYPPASRLVSVQAQVDSRGDPVDHQDLTAVQFSNGRKVNGLVTRTANGKDVGLPFSQLRFFRVTTIGGKPVSIPLATTIADDAGRYSVILPAVMSTTARGGSQ